MQMAELYCRHGTPFVMGTTGGDRDKLVRDAEARGHGRRAGGGATRPNGVGVGLSAGLRAVSSVVGRAHDGEACGAGRRPDP